MNSSYNKDVAVTALEELYQGRMKEDEQLRTFLLDAKLSDYRVQLSNNPPCWRIVTGTGDDAYEAYFRVIGLLALSDLPPVRRANLNLRDKQVRNLRQKVTLTGLSSSSFRGNVEKLRDFGQFFRDYFAGKDIMLLAPALYEGHRSLVFHNRFFTDRALAPAEENLAFEDGIDPEGVLSQLQEQAFIHCSDNVVKYVALRKGQGTSKSPEFVKILPQQLQPGDIVEATVSFMVVKGKNDVHHMFGILRGLCLLDPTIRQASVKARAPVRLAYLPIKVVEKAVRVKRKNIYEEEEVEKTMMWKLAVSDSD
ncbi:hypothetical protein NLJ89_g9666 [Agrocybe chaxingu]|uniref:Uncharacterized protein n=1 Tax=Agrocybe chaxingu TaxID=84603 RepID=A0A9W8MSV6_9AGAR|nr:hypothetical protein NLJ89_g9666 [Agrocybe chaxingu]